MTHAQFLHINTFGNTPRTGASRHATAVGILNEAARLDGATGHLGAPQPPRLLFGAPPNHLIAAAKTLGERARDSRGRKLRSDGGLLAALVISYPTPRTQIDDHSAATVYQNWRAATLTWLATRFPTALESVVEHVDEEQLHLHAFLLPTLLADGQLCWSSCHPGLAARQAAAREGKNKTAQNFCYVQAMRQLQDDFYQTVSAAFDHARTGPLRERRRREEHLKLTAVEKKLAQTQAIVAKLRAALADHNLTEFAQFDPDTSFGDIASTGSGAARPSTAANSTEQLPPRAPAAPAFKKPVTKVTPAPSGASQAALMLTSANIEGPESPWEDDKDWDEPDRDEPDTDGLDPDELDRPVSDAPVRDREADEWDGPEDVPDEDPSDEEDMDHYDGDAAWIEYDEELDEGR